MRVLGSEATADPTAVEAQVRQQMEDRAQVRCHTWHAITLLSCSLMIPWDRAIILLTPLGLCCEFVQGALHCRQKLHCCVVQLHRVFDK